MKRFVLLAWLAARVVRVGAIQIGVGRDRRRAAVLLCALLWVLPAAALTPSDELLNRLQPQGMLSDFAGVLDAAQRQALERRLQALERNTTAAIAVVTLDSLQGGQIDDFTHKLFNRWGVGQKGRNNGVMVLVALKDRQARIEVGYGLEPILPDAVCGRILDEEMFPQFKEGQYARGLTRAVDQLVARIERGEPATAAERAPAPRRGGQEPHPLALAAFLSIFVALGCFLAGAGAGARTFFLILWGALFGGMPLVLGAVQGGPVVRFSLIPLAVVMVVWGYRNGRAHPRTYGHMAGKSRRSSGGGWVWGASGGGFSGGGGGGFGGGSSGGGGASGSW